MIKTDILCLPNLHTEKIGEQNKATEFVLIPWACCP